MTKKFTIQCDFGTIKAPIDVYIGNPKQGNHPLQHQSGWLAKERGGTIPADIMDTFMKLLDAADKNGVSFEDLCVYALKNHEQQQKQKQSAQASTQGAEQSKENQPSS